MVNSFFSRLLFSQKRPSDDRVLSMPLMRVHVLLLSWSRNLSGAPKNRSVVNIGRNLRVLKEILVKSPFRKQHRVNVKRKKDP